MMIRKKALLLIKFIVLTLVVSAGSSGGVWAVRMKQNPIITPQLSTTLEDNINGPSLIKVPGWVPNPLGRYYLYFSHHHGGYIRLAYADKLEGPWRIYEPGTLKIQQTECTDHIASPDVHVDDVKNEIRMYFHCPFPDEQVSLVSVSSDGIHFTASSEVLGAYYFRVFQWDGIYYAMARTGELYRSSDGLSGFEPGPNPFKLDSSRFEVRHVAVKLHGNILNVFYSRVGDRPESILLSEIVLTRDWKNWRVSEPQVVLKPEMDYEGVNLPLKRSKGGSALEPVRQLRDPAIFSEGGRTYLLYSIAGEGGIAIAELFFVR